jgi:hypothetical protein
MEVLMALMILGVGLASVLAVFVAGVRASHDVVNESAAAVAAKAVVARILAEENADGERVFVSKIIEAREGNEDVVWIHAKACYGDSDVPDPAPVAEGSLYSWRCRASQYHAAVGDPTADAENPPYLGPGKHTLAADRVKRGEFHPDSNELWRLTVEIFRSYKPGQNPLGTYQTYICTARR